MTDEQKAFEQWYLAQCPLNSIDKTPPGLKQSPDKCDIYCKPATRRAWAAWKAGAAYRPASKYPVELAQAAIEEYVREADKTSGSIKTIITLLRDCVRHPDNDKLMQDAATVLSRIPKAIEELRSQIDGGEECRGRDQQISEVIRILEGK